VCVCVCGGSPVCGRVCVASAGLVGGGVQETPTTTLGGMNRGGSSLRTMCGSGERVFFVFVCFVDFTQLCPRLVDCFELLFGQSLAVCEF
jgi:hypothetical protein